MEGGLDMVVRYVSVEMVVDDDGVLDTLRADVDGVSVAHGQLGREAVLSLRSVARVVLRILKERDRG